MNDRGKLKNLLDLLHQFKAHSGDLGKRLSRLSRLQSLVEPTLQPVSESTHGEDSLAGAWVDEGKIKNKAAEIAIVAIREDSTDTLRKLADDRTGHLRP